MIEHLAVGGVIIAVFSWVGWFLDRLLVLGRADDHPTIDKLGDALGDGAQWEDELNQLVRNYKYLVTCDALPVDWKKFEILIDCALRGIGPPPELLGSDETIESPNFYADPTIKRGLAAMRSQTPQERDRRLQEKVVEELRAGAPIVLPDGYEMDEFMIDQVEGKVISLFRVPPHHLGDLPVQPDDTETVAR